MCGVDVRVVDLRGNGRFSPQSPRLNALSDVSIAACTGYGRVAVSDPYVVMAAESDVGFGRVCGTEKRREVLNRLPAGDILLRDIYR